MFVLSFRDMGLPRCGAVTSAAVYKLDPLSSAYAWTPPNVAGLALATWSEVQRAFAGKHVLFVVHGFNVDRNNGFTSEGAFAQQLMGLGPPGALPSPLQLMAPGVDLVVPVLWPGDWYLPINYPFVLADARAAGRNFADFLLSSAVRLAAASFFSHSFGVRVVLETVQRACTASAAYARPRFDTAVLTAAAVSDTVLDSPAYAAAVAALRSIAVVSARTDGVLAGAFPLGNVVEQALWTNDAGADVALGHGGPVLQPDSPARPKTRWFDIRSETPPVDQQHGDYLPAPGSDPAPGYADGWSDKRVRVAALAQTLVSGHTPAWPESSPIPPP